MQEYEQYPRVAQLVDEYKLVLNRGRSDGIEVGERFLIFRVGEAVIDPVTKENLGDLEIVIGKAKVVYVQDKICTVESDERRKIPGDRRIIKRSGGIAAFGSLTEEVEERPTEQAMTLDAEIGDYAKPI